jgi:hypothetical protein
VVELAALEMLCMGNRTVGSNPTLSAIPLPIADCRLPICALRRILFNNTRVRISLMRLTIRISQLVTTYQ